MTPGVETQANGYILEMQRFLSPDWFLSSLAALRSL